MRTGRVGCGVSYAVKRSGSSSVGYCALSIRCGTRDEDGYPEGIAHFTEHTVFKGTQHKSASVVNSYLDKLGGELNAYTTKEEIVIHATVLKEDVKKAASLLLELATQPVFPKHEIDLEKQVVIDEIASYKDSPSEDVYDRFESMLFEGHPLKRMILGTVSSVKNITRDNLESFVKERFTPDKMVISIVADEDEAKLEALVDSLVSRFFPASLIVTYDRILAPVIPGIFDKTLNKRNHQANAVLGSVAPSLYDEEERIPAILLCNILGGPASNSILNSVLRERHGWVYGVECSYTQYSDTGIVAVCLGCDRDNLEKCLAAVRKETDKLSLEPLSPRKIQAAKKQLLGQMAISSDNGETQCLSIGKSMLSYGKVASSEENKAKIAAVTAEDIQKMAAKMFAPESMSSLVFL